MGNHYHALALDADMVLILQNRLARSLPTS
jgi:hypothetical protein